VVALVAVSSRAEEAVIPAELASIRAQIGELEARLTALEKQQSDLGAQRAALEGELRLAGLKVRETEAERVNAERAVALATGAATRSQAMLEEAVQRLRLQVTVLSMLGRSGLAPLVVEAVFSGKDVQEKVTLALALVREEKRQRDEAARLMDVRAAALSELSRQQQGLADVADELDRRRGLLEETRRRVEAELAHLESERRTGAVALADATESEARLERLWGIVASGGDTRSSDIRLLRGGLPWPVKAPTVVAPFGKRRDAQYGTFTVSHGLLLDVPPGEPVTALAAGKVAYAQFFKGYGNLVIVDHGSEVYSLYARLASMLVSGGA
jgi:murein hydrolase activator